MAIRVYRVAVVGCPRSAITDETDSAFKGVGKSCLCNRFVRSQAYTEAHDSVLCEDDWKDKPIYNGDHFIYWGAATKHLQDGSKVRFQIVEHTEFYDLENTDKLCAHPADNEYITRASAVRFTSQSSSKISYRLQAEQVHAARNFGSIRATQLFPSEDFGGKAGTGVYGYICVFDPTLKGEEMKKQLDYLAELLYMLWKKKRKVVIACVKCDAVEETQIRYGSNLAAYAAKKPIPFFEVSSREGVNVEDVFFSLIGPPKKHKPSSKNGRHSASPPGYVTYKEAISLRKNDLNRARDAYRKLLQRKVTEFSSVWIEMFPVLEREPEFSAVLHLGGKEGKEIVKKMFCLRLIEIKLMEASKLYGFSSAKKKLDKDQSRLHQVYLSESFKGHPDLGTESLYDYVYSPSSNEGFGLPRDDSDLTEPSTSSRQDTPDGGAKPFSPSSLLYNHGNGRVPIPLPPRPRSATCGSYPRYPLSENSAWLPYDTLPIPSRKKSLSIAELENKANAPPLPSRDEIVLPLRKKSSQSQPFLDVDSKPGPLKREGEAKRLSNSMEILLLPEATNTDTEAEPYMEPIRIQMVLGALPPLPVPATNKRGFQQFRSMRVPNQSPRPMLPKLHTIDSSTSSGSAISQSPVGRSTSMKSRGHRRTQSNPWVLESRLSTDFFPPPAVPPRVVGPSKIPPPVPPRDTHKHRHSKTPPPTSSRKASDGDIMSPIESSLDFPNGENLFWRGLPLPGIVADKEVDDDNVSTISGPFDEIDDGRRKMGAVGHGKEVVTPTEISLTPSHHSMPRNSAITLPDEGSDEDDNQYAKIDEFQQYMLMASANSNLPANHGNTFPLPPHSPAHDETDDKPIRKSQHTKNFSQKILGSGYPKRASTFTPSSKGSRPISSIWKRKTMDPVIPESPEHSGTSNTSQSGKSPRRSPRSERRPLPPSPTKGMKGDAGSKKMSSGANIYEVIDEDFVSRVKSRRMISDEGSFPEWAPPVNPQFLVAYLKIVQQFFSIPEVHKQWVDTVNSLVPDADPENFPPPFYEPPEEEEDDDEELQPFMDKETESEASPLMEESPKPKPKRQLNDDEIPIVLSPRFSPRLFQHSPKSPFSSPHLTTRVMAASSPLVLKKVNSRDDMIAMMNQMNSSDSSDDEDSESEDSNDSDTEDDTDTDGDHEGHKDQSDHEDRSQHETDSNQHQDDFNSNNNNHEQILLNIVQTDLDSVASALRSSVSTDSDLASDAVKSPHSNSIEEVDNIQCSSEVIGKEKPSILVPRRRSPRRKGVLGDARNLSDSGISQTFEDVQNFESEC